MYSRVNVTDRIYYLGVNDRRKELFENIWPLPYGVSYNSYLIDDDRTALVDTVEMGTGGDFVGWIKELLGERKLDYLIISHMEPDHSGEIENVVRANPGLKIVGNKKTFQILEAFFGITDNLVEVKDGDVLDLGHRKLTFVMTPWVHWPETMMTYVTEEGILFSGDAFGTFGALSGGVFDDEIDFSFFQGEMLRYYSNIVGKYSNMVQRAFAKLSALPVRTICPLHGPVWRTDPGKVLGLYDRWSKQEGEEGVVLVYASMYGNTARIADYVARGLADNGVKEVLVHDVSKTHMSFIVRDVWKYRGVILGGCTYNAEMFPLLESLTREFEHMSIKNKLLGLFGTYAWNGGCLRRLKEFAERIKWDTVAEPVEIMGQPTEEKVKVCDPIFQGMAARLKS